MGRIFPSWDDINRLKASLTKGERHLAEYLDEHLPKDNNFNHKTQSLSEYNGWLIFLQPFLNGLRPDVIIFHPKIGIQIIEVKDWNLSHYVYKDGNVHYNNNNKVLSPIRQVERYKEKILGQLVPIIGEKNDNNKSSYGIIKTSLYFHYHTEDDLRNFFIGVPKNNITFIGWDSLSDLQKVVPDFRWCKSKYWCESWNNDLLFWLKPPIHFIEQGTLMNLTKSQLKMAKATPGHHRMRGTAGSGKTLVLAHRAAELASQGYKVLIVTFNITLWHIIKDMINRTPFKFSWDSLVFNHFHSFCADVIAEAGLEWPKDQLGEDFFVDTVANEVHRALKILGEYNKYDAILIDEGQDFNYKWYWILDKFLTERDELLIACDKNQNIYERNLTWLDKRLGNQNLEKFGEWNDLKKSFRLPADIYNLAKNFSEEFNIIEGVQLNQNLGNQLQNQKNMSLEIFSNFKYRKVIEENYLDELRLEIENLNGSGVHPSDICVLFLNNINGQKMVDYFGKEKDMDINHVFEKNDKKRKRHKRSFWMGDSRLKASTIHSFKGWEINYIILYLPPNLKEGKKNDALIYTSITRAKQNLIILNASEAYHDFFSHYH